MKKLVVLALTLAALAAVLVVPAFAATSTIGLRDNYFSPSSRSVPRGTTVKWIWKESAPHNVTVTSGPVKFRSRTQTKGTFSKTLTKPGLYKIVCTIHPGMRLNLRVR